MPRAIDQQNIEWQVDRLLVLPDERRQQFGLADSETIAYRVVSNPALNPYHILGQMPRGHGPFLARNLAIGLIVCAVALRYSYVSQQWRLRVEGEARARVDALQARIRPHFLYNSMNTIAALTRTDVGWEETFEEGCAALPPAVAMGSDSPPAGSSAAGT